MYESMVAIDATRILVKKSRPTYVNDSIIKDTTERCKSYLDCLPDELIERVLLAALDPELLYNPFVLSKESLVKKTVKSISLANRRLHRILRGIDLVTDYKAIEQCKPLVTRFFLKDSTFVLVDELTAPQSLIECAAHLSRKRPLTIEISTMDAGYDPILTRLLSSLVAYQIEHPLGRLSIQCIQWNGIRPNHSGPQLIQLYHILKSLSSVDFEMSPCPCQACLLVIPQDSLVCSECGIIERFLQCQECSEDCQLDRNDSLDESWCSDCSDTNVIVCARQLIPSV